MRCSNQYRALLPLFFVMLANSPPPVVCAADDIDAQAINNGKQLLKSQKKQALVAFFAHPSAKLNNIDFQKVSPSDKGFKLIYKFNFTSALNNPFYSKLALEFDVDGNYRTVDCVATSGLVEPFTASGLVLQMVKKRITENPTLQKSKELIVLVENTDVKGLLKFMLKIEP